MSMMVLCDDITYYRFDRRGSELFGAPLDMEYGNSSL